MMVRPRFVSPDAHDIINNIRTNNTTYSIGQDGNDELFLEVRPSDDEIFRFHLEYSADLASGVNRSVVYENTHIMFTDEVNWDSGSETESDFFIEVQPDDYIVPMFDDVEECPVCYEAYEPMYGSLCGHRACVDCMRKMDRIGLTKCPMCRSDDFKFPIAMACNKIFVSV
jgi:hypothetical protein